jgi:hypothetical protein
MLALAIDGNGDGDEFVSSSVGVVVQRPSARCGDNGSHDSEAINVGWDRGLEARKKSRGRGRMQYSSEGFEGES